MNIKIIFLLIFFLLISCNSIKIRGIEMDTTQELVGDIKSMTITTIFPPIEGIDTGFQSKSVLFFDKKNKISRRIDYYSKSNTETVFNYNNELLENSTATIKNGISKSKYKYDKNGNLIAYNEFRNDTLTFSKISKYDEKNNLLEQTYSHPNYKNINSFEKYIHDYKNKNVIIKSYDKDNKEKKSYLKLYYDNKGYTIKTEAIYNDTNKESSSLNYDKNGNLTKRTSFDYENIEKGYSIYKNTYDKKGNIIVREVYSKEGLIQKTIYEITYNE